MLTYDEATEFIGGLYQFSPRAKGLLKQRLRQFRAKGLISPLSNDERETLDSHTFSLAEICKASIFSALADFGCDKNVLRIIADSLKGRMVAANVVPNELVRPKTRFDSVIEKIEAGEQVYLCVGADLDGCRAYWPVTKPDGNFAREGDEGFRTWETAPNGPLIVLPLREMLAPILSIKDAE